MRIITVILLTAILGFACKKDDEQKKYSSIPEIELVSLSKDSLVQFKDSLIIFISYNDADGDLGRHDPDDNSLWIKDDRVPEGEFYHLPPLVSDNDDSFLNTSGTMRVFIPSLFLFGNGNIEKTTLSIHVSDRSGNVSNTLVTPTITVTRD